VIRLLVLVLALLAGCEQDARQHDCQQVRSILDARMPRRYYAYSELQKLPLRDPAVKRAVGTSDMKTVVALCPSPRAREHDCALVRMYVPSTEDEKRGTRFFDPNVPNADFEDAEVRAAMLELGSNGWTAYAPSESNSAASYAKLRKLCKIP
jgi:hypothetical protein